jgi:hypothetical protein
MTSVPNENILKLRELTNKICKTNPSNHDYKLVVDELKKVINEGKKDIEKSDCDEEKINCYESMCVTIMNIINKIK